MTRIAVGGFHHETNTFAPSPADMAAFRAGHSWPAFVEGEAMAGALGGCNIGAAGFIDRARGFGWETVPLAWASATPSAAVTRDAYETIAGSIAGRLEAALPVDAVYLCLHGAMVAEHLDDGEGELLARVRRVVGDEIPVVATLDLHANVTPLMAAQATILDAYRTYPHVDMARTGRRCATVLNGILRSGRPIFGAYRQIPYLIPITAQATDTEPARSIYREVEAVIGDSVVAAAFTPGFPAADIPDCGPAVMAYALEPEDAERAADRLEALVLESEGRWESEILSPKEAVRRALSIATTARRPVIIADAQDNPGGGGDSDTTGMLRALIDGGATDAVLGLLFDPDAASAAHRAGAGAEIEISLGGRSGVAGDAPMTVRAWVDALGDGEILGTGPMYGGTHLHLGPMARLRVAGVDVVVASGKAQLADREMLRHVGVEPEEAAIIVVKSSVHFRADFAPIAEAVLVAAAPGPVRLDPLELPFARLRPDLRLRPFGPTLAERAG